jgi:predicted RND superfamily exporter protein
MERLSHWVVPRLIRRRWWVLGIAILVSAIGGLLTIRLYSDLRSDVEELLPSNAPSVVAAKKWGKKLHNITHLSVVLEGKDAKALQRFADDLAKRLAELPPGLIETIDYKTDEEAAFAKRFGAQYVETEDLRDILGRIQRRVAWEKRNANPLLDIVDDGTEPEPAPPLDISDIEKKYAEAQGALDRFRDGYYQTQDGHLLAMLIRPPEMATGYHVNKRLWDKVRDEVKALNPASYEPEMRVGYNGEVASLVEEQESLMEDLVFSTVVVLVLVLTVLWFYFRNWPAIWTVFLPLGLGCAVTFGLAEVMVGHLNANTAFLGSIVIGNGINVAIIMMARFMEERRRGLEVPEAIRVSWRTTFAATFVAAFSAGLAYMSLAATAFRGFNQFGVIGGVGMAACWLAAVVLLPSCLATIDAHWPIQVRPERENKHGIFRWVSEVVERRSTLLQGISLFLVCACIAAAFNYRGDLIESDVTRLRSQKSRESGALYWGNKLDLVFGRYLSPIVIVGDTPEDTRKLVPILQKNRKEMGTADPLREVRTLEMAVPPDAAERVDLLKKIRAELTESRLAQLDEATREKVERFIPPADIRPVTIDDLPKSIRISLTEKDGTAGRIALAFPRRLGSLDSRTLEEITSLIRGSIAEAGASADAISQSLLFADIASAITRDGPLATLMALSAVTLLVILTFRRVRPVVSVMIGLLLGVVWLLGIAAAFQVRVNFLNFVVLPICFGIGVDYAVNIVQRYRLEGPGSLGRVIRETGSAVALCSCTTVIGYSSLLVADNRTLAGFGLLASIGEVTCLLAASMVLPSWLLRREGRWKARREVPS